MVPSYNDWLGSIIIIAAFHEVGAARCCMLLWRRCPVGCPPRKTDEKDNSVRNPPRESHSAGVRLVRRWLLQPKAKFCQDNKSTVTESPAENCVPALARLFL